MISLLESRINKLYNRETNKTVIIPIDHGFYLGNIKGLEDPYNVMETLIKEKVDATLMSLGIAKITRELFNVKDAPAKVLTIDYPMHSNVPGEFHGQIEHELAFTVEQALKWDFCAVKVMLPWGLQPELQMKVIKNILTVQHECDRNDMPLMIEPLVLGECIPKEKINSPEMIAHAARLSLELGADILKIAYTGNKKSFKEIVDRSHVPVIVLGGPKMNSTADMFRIARESVEAGGKGIVFGRNVWQNERLVELIRGLKDAVYNCEDENEIVKKYNL
jgi:class I fructose-bisphosphate aldolase